MVLHNAIDRAGARGYFASANTKNGFFSLFSEIYNEKNYKSIYILKGGPGTGKSTLLDKIAARASSLGLDTEVFLCSSDVSSLDGVVINELGVAVIDGTAPHAQEPFYPGACGQIINLGENWDSDKLKSERHAIELLFLKKSSAYSRAYRYLAAAGIADDDIIAGIGAAVDHDKMTASIKRMLCKYIRHGDGEESVKRRFVTANATGGIASVDTLYKTAARTVTVNYSYGAGRLYLDAVRREGERRGLRMITSPTALSPEHTESVLFTECDLLVTLASDDVYERGDVCINTKRFIENDVLSKCRMKQRFSEKVKTILLGEAVKSLGEAGRVHAEIEELYKSAMDFDGVADVGEKLIEKIFG